MNLAIIPVRGGSKRLYKKNTMLLNGLPLFLHSILYARENSDIVDEVIVSTDNAEIKKLALDNNIKVIDRPIEISGDQASTVSALKHVLISVKENYDNVMLLQATNPLRPKDLLQLAYEKYNSENFDSLMTVSRVTHKLGKIISGKFIPFNYSIGQRSQDLEPLFYENGLLYITKASLILEDIIVGNQNFPFIVDHPYANVDIDTAEDFKHAEFILENYKNNE